MIKSCSNDVINFESRKHFSNSKQSVDKMKLADLLYRFYGLETLQHTENLKPFSRMQRDFCNFVCKKLFSLKSLTSYGMALNKIFSSKSFVIRRKHKLENYSTIIARISYCFSAHSYKTKLYAPQLLIHRRGYKGSFLVKI